MAVHLGYILDTMHCTVQTFDVKGNKVSIVPRCR